MEKKCDKNVHHPTFQIQIALSGPLICSDKGHWLESYFTFVLLIKCSMKVCFKYMNTIFLIQTLATLADNYSYP
jgi:5'(3')-deoxyribonucleotidase